MKLFIGTLSFLFLVQSSRSEVTQDSESQALAGEKRLIPLRDLGDSGVTVEIHGAEEERDGSALPMPEWNGHVLVGGVVYCACVHVWAQCCAMYVVRVLATW